MVQKAGLTMAQVAGHLGVKPEAARRWVRAFEEITGADFLDPGSDARFVPPDVAAALERAKGLMAGKVVDSRKAAINTVLTDGASDSPAGGQVDAGSEQLEGILSRLDLIQVELRELQSSAESQHLESRASLLRGLAEESERYSRAVQEATHAAVSASLDGSTHMFAENVARVAREAATRTGQAVSEAFADIVEVSEVAREAGAAFEAMRATMKTDAQRLSVDLTSFRNNIRYTLDRIRSTPHVPIDVVAISGAIGMALGSAFTYMWLALGWQFLAVATVVILALGYGLTWLTGLVLRWITWQ